MGFVSYLMFVLLACVQGATNEKGESIFINGDIIQEIMKMGLKISEIDRKLESQKDHIMNKFDSQITDINTKLDYQKMLTQLSNQKIDTGVKGLEEKLQESA